jgi:hypothetical protein
MFHFVILRNCGIINTESEGTTMTTFEKTYRKAQQRRTNKTKCHHWKGYSFKYYIVFPLVLVNYAWRSLNDFYTSKITWDPNRAKRVLDDTLPYILDEEDGELVYSMTWSSFNFRRWAKLKDKRFCGIYVYNIREYLKEEYEIEGYTKALVDDDVNYSCWVIFQKKKENNS